MGKNIFYGNGGKRVYNYHRIRDLREDHDRTQKKIAQYLNMQLTVYQRYERGEREIPLWAAIKLAEYYQVSLDYLVNYDRLLKRRPYLEIRRFAGSQYGNCLRITQSFRAVSKEQKKPA